MKISFPPSLVNQGHQEGFGFNESDFESDLGFNESDLGSSESNLGFNESGFGSTS